VVRGEIPIELGDLVLPEMYLGTASVVKSGRGRALNRLGVPGLPNLTKLRMLSDIDGE
jgi:hypothetical protein